ncbi:hypothetical protein TNCV_615491 [Trichonephila clavipes]|nr:hypothetical protein TNCV_615491 [Trichonephila clavipes]
MFWAFCIEVVAVEITRNVGDDVHRKSTAHIPLLSPPPSPLLILISTATTTMQNPYLFTNEFMTIISQPPQLCSSHLEFVTKYGNGIWNESANLEMGFGMSQQIWKWEIVNPDQDNGTKLLNDCIVIRS